MKIKIIQLLLIRMGIGKNHMNKMLQCAGINILLIIQFGNKFLCL